MENIVKPQQQLFLPRNCLRTQLAVIQSEHYKCTQQVHRCQSYARCQDLVNETPVCQCIQVRHIGEWDPVCDDGLQILLRNSCLLTTSLSAVAYPQHCSHTSATRTPHVQSVLVHSNEAYWGTKGSCVCNEGLLPQTQG